MPFRKPIGLLLAALMVTATAPAFNAQAQTKTPTPPPKVTPAATAAVTLSATDTTGFKCTLAKTDCDLLATAEANIGSETSFQQAITFKMAITQAGSHPTNVNVQATGTGAFSIDPTADITDTNALYKAVQFQLNLTGSAAPQSGKIGILLKDGILYAQGGSSVSWTGIDLAQLTAISSAAPTSGTQSATNQALQSALAEFLLDPAVKTALAALPNTPGWIVQQRLADTTLEGQRMEQIQYTYDPQALFRSSGVAVLFKKFFVALSDQLPADTQGLDQIQSIAKLSTTQMQGALLLLGSVLGKSNMKYIRWIGVTDKKIHALNLIINVNLVPSALNVGTTTTPTQPPINGTINFSVQVTKIGKPVTLTVPSNATILTQAQLERLLGRTNSLSTPGGLSRPVGTATPTQVAPVATKMAG